MCALMGAWFSSENIIRYQYFDDWKIASLIAFVIYVARPEFAQPAAAQPIPGGANTHYIRRALFSGCIRNTETR